MGQRTKKRRRGRPPGREQRPSLEHREELDAARRRATVAKAGFAAAIALAFTVGMSLARHTYAGHAKQPVVPLAAPPRYDSIVRKNLLQAGVVGPAQAPPGAATAPS
jgi:hypothetical protein